jgi:CHAT domain-containing protein
MPRCRFVHLATHGFFADAAFRSAFHHDLAGESMQLGGFELLGRRSTITGRNPLILSGVVLAGADRPAGTPAPGDPAGDDGILTAEEVADLDLSGTELVVLSACETGLGEVAGGEGVFGLQRAFALGGARTVIATLWKIDDRATQALMGEFYRQLWREGAPAGKLEALRRAQLAMIRRYDRDMGSLRGLEPIDSGGPTPGPGRRSLPPFFWAAFTLNGDWR